MNIRVSSNPGMGSLISRAWTTGVYGAWKLANPADATLLEGFVPSMTAEAQYIALWEGALELLPDGSFKDQISEHFLAAKGKLGEINDAVKVAVQAAIDDGATIRNDNGTVSMSGLGVLPLVVAVVAVAAVVIVCAYLSYSDTVTQVRTYYTHKAAIDALRTAHPELIPATVNPQGGRSGSSGGWGDQIGKAGSTILMLGGAGFALWFFAQSRRKRGGG